LGCLLTACPDESESSTQEEVIAHPFMYVTADRRDSILDNIKTEPMATLYKGLQEEAIGDLTPIDTTDWDAKDHGKNGELAAINAFLAWINNDENAAQRALDAMATLESNWDDHTQWASIFACPHLCFTTRLPGIF